MIKFFLIILIIFSGCSLEKKSIFKDKVTTENKETDIKKIPDREIIKEDFNKELKINLSKIIINNKFRELKNNYGRQKFKSDLKKFSKYNFKKIKNF